ncbi:hypothetical protein [Amycolatopsis sp. Hca4]|uniref:hypothetical protein n=1 Tax=Amycolatopsis sp. Hca4 TaxID=2742131 RepID=UPI0015917AD9|nr:hypothetical protein [Amycolatopsis sp. Hca4]QKV74018.1 hypothetical protein HUT10_09725 [Amycolatopsis sp. Hca4]
MSADESAPPRPGRTQYDLDAEYPYFYLSENISPTGRGVPAWSGMVAASAGKVKLLLPARVSRACVAIEVHCAAPAAALDDFDDAIEFGYPSATGACALLDWSSALVSDLPLLPDGPGDYRVRYHVRAAAGPGAHSLRHVAALVQIWPGTCRELTELKITSAFGEFWHPGAGSRRPVGPRQGC